MKTQLNVIKFITILGALFLVLFIEIALADEKGVPEEYGRRGHWQKNDWTDSHTAPAPQPQTPQTDNSRSQEQIREQQEH
jgi:hypothetical protein